MMKRNEIICVVCPMGCHLNVSVDGSVYKVEGNKCKKGKIYAINELSNPLRTVTSTVRINGANICRLPVKTKQAFPKGRMLELMSVLSKVEVEPPVKLEQVILKDVLGTGVDLVSTKTVLLKSTLK